MSTYSDTMYPFLRHSLMTVHLASLAELWFWLDIELCYRSINFM